MDWPADKVERRSVKKLTPYARNARTHSDEQISQIAASIKEWGWTVPVLVDEAGGIIAGHGRIMAADRLGIKDVPVMVASGWSDAQKQAYIIADNKLALNAGWDNDMLAVELGELQDLDFDLSLVGFDESELAGLLEKTEGLTDPDQVPDVQDEVVTRLGDRWMLGKHRLKCGDSTSADDVASLLAGVEPHLMVTDPPYGVNYDPNQRRRFDGAKSNRTYIAAESDTNVEWGESWALFPGDVAYIWHSDKQIIGIGESMIACGFDLRQQIIWAKNSLTLTRNHYRYQHEHCWYAVKKSAHWAGENNATTLWKIDKVNAETGHGAQKPVECMRRPIVNNSSPGQAVYDPFLGSGTTLIAGEMEGRHVYGMELSPQYCDVIIRRWQAFTGKDAIIDEAAASWTFNEVADNRMSEAA